MSKNGREQRMCLIKNWPKEGTRSVQTESDERHDTYEVNAKTGLDTTPLRVKQISWFTWCKPRDVASLASLAFIDSSLEVENVKLFSWRGVTLCYDSQCQDFPDINVILKAHSYRNLPNRHCIRHGGLNYYWNQVCNHMTQYTTGWRFSTFLRLEWLMIEVASLPSSWCYQLTLTVADVELCDTI